MVLIGDMCIVVCVCIGGDVVACYGVVCGMSAGMVVGVSVGGFVWHNQCHE